VALRLQLWLGLPLSQHPFWYHKGDCQSGKVASCCQLIVKFQTDLDASNALGRNSGCSTWITTLSPTL
jgi:hypothetical protein